MSKALTRSTGLVGSMTLISRIVGFIRDMLVAQYFGAGVQYDAFLVAFKLPNFFRSLLGEGAFSQAFVPLLAEYRDQKSPQEAQAYVNAAGGALTWVALILTILGVLTAPTLIHIFAPGFETTGERFDLAVHLLRITFPYIFFISLTAFMAGLLNTYGHFFAPAFAPTLLNIAMIIAMVVLTSRLAIPVESLAIGVLLGGIAQFIFQWCFLSRIDIRFRPMWGFNDPGVRRLLKLMVPLIYGASIVQINLLISTIFASALPVGSISWLYYAERMMQFPLGVFGVALSTVALPHLAKGHARSDKKYYNEILDWSLKLGILIALPAAIGLGVLAKPILATLFQYGKFSANDVWQSEKALQCYAIGLLAFILVKVLSVACYAKQDMKGPVYIATASLIFNVILNLILMPTLKHVGLALATSLSALLTGGLLWMRLRRYHNVVLGAHTLRFLVRVGAANLCMAIALWFLAHQISDWAVFHALIRGGFLTGMILLGMAIYFGVLWAVGLRVRDVITPTHHIPPL